jgi:hypothetical protein
MNFKTPIRYFYIILVETVIKANLHTCIAYVHLRNKGRGTSKFTELVPHPFKYINKICSKQEINFTFENTCRILR